jgi:hypothetical protein
MAKEFSAFHSFSLVNRYAHPDHNDFVVRYGMHGPAPEPSTANYDGQKLGA